MLSNQTETPTPPHARRVVVVVVVTSHKKGRSLLHRDDRLRRVGRRWRGLLGPVDVLVVEVVRVDGALELPAVLGDEVEVVEAAREGVAVRRAGDGAAAEVDGLLDGEVGAQVRVDDAVRVRRARADAEHVALEPRPIIVDVVQLRALGVPAADHRAHRQTLPAVLVHRVGQQLGRVRDRDALLVPELVHAALEAEIALPKRTVGRTARHRPEQERVDLDDLLDRLARDVVPLRRPRVDRDDDASVELEGERSRALGELDELVRVGAVADGEVGF
mmetsp:Transcript_27186/g.108849  ORF Transcript_27186/g.108849 Transcript_27186/m.108849 type:complete len:275 (-) Transcript_27186:198-1022(-)